MKNKLFETSESYAPLILRLILGFVVLMHGMQKLFGLFGGLGFSKTMLFFTESVGLPWIMGFLIITLETAGAIALIIGLGTRLIAFSYIMLPLGMIFTTHLKNGFFMNWFGTLKGEGYEYFILWIGMALALFILGGGKYAIDKIFIEK
ncbi:putative oxidoreductase [Flavobacterium sp. 90]|uniref:DoxX family protein n=1 Tax=unclassified Flavobacterium TaxID=196869 RepID=UPI000EAE493C|nr:MULTISPECIES: DoxX family protein [unclassified Flavobacterium]RKR05057.1 putative oxidoreductase [Flavobacterium sp. 81]TCK56373.1 putative oxidoreductase [Flavobacterium sp. 90]